MVGASPAPTERSTQPIQMFVTNGPRDPASSFHPLLTVLLVQADLDDAVEAGDLLKAHVPSLRILRAHTVAQARRLLERESVDLVVTDHELEDGSCAAVAGFAGERGDPPPVLAQIRGTGKDADSIRSQVSTLLDCVPVEEGHRHLLRSPVQYLQAILRVKEQSGDGWADDDSLVLLQQVRRTLSRVNHDLNNPLSIISGNAQLLIELARALDLDNDLVQPLKDIEEASGRVSTILRRLVDLRDRLPADQTLMSDVLAELRDPGEC